MKKKAPLSKIFFFTPLLLILTTFVSFVYLNSLFRPVQPTSADQRPPVDVQFVIPKGQAISIIAGRLAEEKIIRNAWVFRFIVKKNGLENKLQAGSFSLNPAMSPTEIAETLTSGSEDMWVTIQEGWRKEEIAESMTRQGFVAFDETEFLALAKKSEGKLFPDTYLLPKLITAQAFYDLLINTFDKKTATILAEAKDQGKDINDILTMASIVEREGRGSEDLRVVSGVLWNRIEIGMPLQADATLQYAKGYDEVQNSWWSEPTASDKDRQSPYNTYLNPGLPPAPISNPGLEAIQAALNPVPSDYLYYLHDRSGIGRYAITYDDHLNNINKYLR